MHLKTENFEGPVGLLLDLIEREAKRGEDRGYVYKPSLNLLEHLGVISLEELSEFTSLSAKLKEFLSTKKQNKEMRL